MRTILDVEDALRTLLRRPAARFLDFGVLVGPLDEGHFRAVPGLRVVTLAS